MIEAAIEDKVATKNTGVTCTANVNALAEFKRSHRTNYVEQVLLNVVDDSSRHCAKLTVK